LLLDHDGYLPSYAVMTEGRKHEVRAARQMRFAPGAILVFDRGYTDYLWFMNLLQQGVYFVTRLKENADYGVVEELAVSQRRGVRRDQVIFFYQLAQAGTGASRSRSHCATFRVIGWPFTVGSPGAMVSLRFFVSG
jgi:hypothetical protein